MLTVSNIKALDLNKLKVTLSNGKTGFFDVTKYTSKGIFSELLNENYFKQVKIDESQMGICWPNEQDFSADTIEAELIS